MKDSSTDSTAMFNPILPPKMKITRLACMLALVGLAGNPPARAAVLEFSPPANCSADTDVRNGGGNQLFAFTWGGAAVVNGVSFTATAATAIPGFYLNLAAFTGANATAFTANAAPFNTLSGSYSNILRGSVFNGTANTMATGTLTNLIPGHTYFVQLWVGDPRSGATTNRVMDVSSLGLPVRLDFNVGNVTGGVGQHTYATFTADAASQDILIDTTMVTAPDGGLPQINAIQLRDITGVWSGTTHGNWSDGDTTSQNFSGLNYSAVKAVTSDVYFGDKDAAGNAVATSTITVGAGGVSGANATFNNSAVAYTLNSADALGITGAGGVTLNGPGTVNLNGPNTFSGSTTVNAGTLLLGHSGALGSTAAIVLGGGTLDASGIPVLTLGSSQTMRGYGTVRGSLEAPSGAGIIPGGTGAAGTLTVTNNLTLNGQAMTFDLPFSPFGCDKVVVGNTLTVNGTVTLSLNYLQGSLAGGTYTLMTFASKAGEGNIVLDASYPGVTLNVNAASVTLSVGGGGGISGVWTNLLGGTWGAATNWLENTIATNVDGIADFGTLDITTARTVTINGVKTIGHLVFGDAVQNANWTLSTGTNVLAVSSGSPKIIINSGQNTTVSASLQGSQGFTKLGTGILTLSGGNYLTGGVNVQAGNLVGSAAGSFGNNTVATANPITLSNSSLTISAALANNAWTNNLVFQGTSNTITAGAATPGFRGTSGGSSVISGGGTVTLSCGGNTPALAGHMDGFSGRLIINASGAGGLLTGHNQDSGFYPGADGLTGSSSAIFEYLGGGVHYLYNGAMPATNYMGELRGDSSAVLWAKNGRSGDVTVEIGGLNTSSVFAGSLRDNRNGTAPTYTSIRKVGIGTLTLSGASLNTGPTEVWNGTLAVSGSLGVTPVTVRTGGKFQLDGSIASPTVNVQSGGLLLLGSGANLGNVAITLNGSMDVTAVGGLFSLGSASLAGSGVVSGSITLASTSVNPGPIGGAGTLTIANGSFTATGGTLAFDLSNTPGSGNDLLEVNGNLDFSTPGITISINKLSGALGAGTYVIARCSGTMSGSSGNLALVGANPLDTLQFNGNQLELVVSAVTSLIWTGDGLGNLWDIGASATWLNGTLSSTFADGNSVTFNNNGATNPIVNIPITVAPAIVTVSGSSNYTFVGAGDISGGTSLAKSGTGALSILNTNTFVGTVFVNGGTLSVGNAAVNGHLSAHITNGAALVYNTPLDQALSNSITGSGTLTKLGAGVLTMAADSTISGPTTITAGTLALGDGIANAGALGTGNITNNATLAINHPNSFTMSNPVRNNGGVVNLSAATVTLSGVISGPGSLTNELSAGTLNLAAANGYAGGTFLKGGRIMLQDFSGFGSGPVALDDFGTGEIHLAPVLGVTNALPNNIKLPAGTQPQFTMDGTSLGLRTTVRLTGLVSGGAAGSPTVFVDSGVAGNTRGVLVLENGANSFTTIPEVYRGTLAFTSDGALGASTNGIRVSSSTHWTAPFDINQQGLRFDASDITVNANRPIELAGSENIDVQGFNGTIAGPVTGLGLLKLGSGTLRLTGSGDLTGATAINNGTLRVDCPWTSGSVLATAGTTLTGTGVISAPIIIQNNATLSPGPGIGTLTLGTKDIQLAVGSVTTMELNAAAVTGDQVAGIGTLNYDGTLTVVNTAGTLAAGQTFQLFGATNYTGNFAATNLPSLDPAYRWNWNPAAGTLAVVSGVATTPTNIVAAVNGSNLDISWPEEYTGWRLEVQTNSLNVGVSGNWFTWPNSASTNAVSVPLDPANPSVFLRLVYP